MPRGDVYDTAKVKCRLGSIIALNSRMKNKIHEIFDSTKNRTK